MSTKASLAHGPNFHIYSEAFDSENIYLELKGVQFEAARDGVTIEIPLAVWEAIRTHTNADVSCTDKSDEQLRQEVEQAVRTRAEEHAKADPSKKGIIGLQGYLAYGSADESIELFPINRAAIIPSSRRINFHLQTRVDL